MSKPGFQVTDSERAALRAAWADEVRAESEHTRTSRAVAAMTAQAEAASLEVERLTSERSASAARYADAAIAALQTGAPMPAALADVQHAADLAAAELRASGTRKAGETLRAADVEAEARHDTASKRYAAEKRKVHARHAAELIAEIRQHDAAVEALRRRLGCIDFGPLRGMLTHEQVDTINAPPGRSDLASVFAPACIVETPATAIGSNVAKGAFVGTIGIAGRHVVELNQPLSDADDSILTRELSYWARIDAQLDGIAKEAGGAAAEADAA